MNFILIVVTYFAVKIANAIRGKPTTVDPHAEYVGEIVAIVIFTAIFGAPAIMMFDSPHSDEGLIPTLFILIVFPFPLVEITASTKKYYATDPLKKTFWKRIQFLYVGLIVLIHVLILGYILLFTRHK